MAELSDAEKDAISHRGRAARELERWLAARGDARGDTAVESARGDARGDAAVESARGDARGDAAVDTARGAGDAG